MTKIDKFINALEKLGDGRYHYYDGKPYGIGCSEYTRLALLQAGIIKSGESFHAGSGNVGVLADTTRFQKVPWKASNLQKGDILWSNGHHVATWDGNTGVYQAAPEDTHGICANGKTGVGHWPKHTYYNCGTGTNSWSWIYRIIDNNTPSGNRTLHEQAQYMIDNNINGANRRKQATADGFKYDDVQAEINRMLAKDKSNTVEICMKYMPIIKNGSKGQVVTILQQQLTYMGYLAVPCDGIFGYYTQTALKAFQANINKVYGNFAVDGICGPKTWARIF